MSCVHLLEVPGAWREFICGISGVHMIARDCLRIAPDCIPWQGLQVALGKVKVEQFPPALQPHLQLAARQASDPTRLPASREREEAAVALGVSPIADLLAQVKAATREARRVRLPKGPRADNGFAAAKECKSKAGRAQWDRRTPEQQAAHSAINRANAHARWDKMSPLERLAQTQAMRNARARRNHS